MSRAFNFVKGLGMSNSSNRVFPAGEVITKAPFRGFSGLISHFIPAALTAFSTAAARVLNAPHDLQCSIVSTPPAPSTVEAFATDDAAVFFAAVFLLVFFGPITTSYNCEHPVTSQVCVIRSYISNTISDRQQLQLLK